MKVSAKAEYACLAVLALAQHAQDAAPLRIREISELHGIPERYLVQILLQLKGAGLVSSTRGAAGGYRLARPSESISIGEVLSAIDGPDLATRDPPRPTAAPRRSWAVSGTRSARPSEPFSTRPPSPRSPRRTSPHEWTI